MFLINVFYVGNKSYNENVYYVVLSHKTVFKYLSWSISHWIL